MYRKIYSHANSIRVLMMMMILTACVTMHAHGCMRMCIPSVQEKAFVTKNLSISPRFSPTIFYRDANSLLLRAHVVCTAVTRNPVFEIIHQQSVKVYLSVQRKA